MQSFVAAWREYQTRAMRQDGPAAVRCFQAIVRMMEYCQEEEPDLDDLTTEDIERNLAEVTEQSIRRSPELAVQAANKIGWTVVPPQTPP